MGNVPSVREKNSLNMCVGNSTGRRVFFVFLKNLQHSKAECPRQRECNRPQYRLLNLLFEKKNLLEVAKSHKITAVCATTGQNTNNDVVLTRRCSTPTITEKVSPMWLYTLARVAHLEHSNIAAYNTRRVSILVTTVYGVEEARV